jgi:hypothetical protein
MIVWSNAAQGSAMSRSRTPARNDVSDASRTAEKARLEARLAKREAWRSLQRLLDRPPGNSLVGAIEVASERERLECELADTCDDYRAWVALSANAGDVSGSATASKADAPQFKTRVRIKAATASKVTVNGKHAATPASVPGTTPIAAAPAPMSSRSTEPVRISPEEARVVIVRRAKDGTVTRRELPASTRTTPGHSRSERMAHSSGPRYVAPETAPQPIAKRPGKR